MTNNTEHADQETWTIKRLLEWTTDFFAKKKLETPRLEAEILLACALGWKRINLYTHFDSEPSATERARFRELVKRRGVGEPAAYLVGRKEFFSISFRVDQNVLIPRPETEQLVLETLDRLKNISPPRPVQVCDVGTGSGAISVALAKNWPFNVAVGKITAVDISMQALDIAKENAENAGVADKIEFLVSDLLHSVTETFDMIVSNPPYVSQAEYDALPREIRDFEPKYALLAGKNGTEIIARLIEESKAKLNPGGWLLLEGSPMIAADVAAMLTAWHSVQIIKDDANLDRFIVAQKAT